MATYWITFRIADDATYDRRYTGVTEAVRAMSSRWWKESTSFLVFESANEIDRVASLVAVEIDDRVDLALIGMPKFQSARAVGAISDPDLFTLLPFTKKV